MAWRKFEMQRGCFKQAFNGVFGLAGSAEHSQVQSICFIQKKGLKKDIFIIYSNFSTKDNVGFFIIIANKAKYLFIIRYGKTFKNISYFP